MRRRPVGAEAALAEQAPAHAGAKFFSHVDHSALPKLVVLAFISCLHHKC